jgi:hypothetical protein
MHFIRLRLWRRAARATVQAVNKTLCRRKLQLLIVLSKISQYIE